MRKFLGSLGTIAIACSLMLSAIDANPFQRGEETKLGSMEVDVLQTNDLVDLSRDKRGDSYGDCVKTTTGAAAGTQVLTGAAVGAAIGSVVPGLGTVIGAAVGSLVGGATGASIGGTAAAFGCSKNEHLDKLYLNLDLGIIDDDDDRTILNELKKLNQALNIEHLYLTEKTDISSKVVASASSIYQTDTSVVVKYMIKRNLIDTSLLLKQWSSMFKEHQREMERQIKEDVPSFSAEQKRTWLDDKKSQLRFLFHGLAQNIFIIKNDEYIKKLYHRVQSLESDLNFLKNKIETLESANSILSLCGAGANAVSVGSNFVPVVGDIVSYVSALVSATCYLVNEFNL